MKEIYLSKPPADCCSDGEPQQTHQTGFGRSKWKTSKDAFEIYPRTNELCYNAGATYEADRILKELPETLEVRKSRDCLMMNLEEAQKFFGITFKKSLFPWLSKIFA